MIRSSRDKMYFGYFYRSAVSYPNLSASERLGSETYSTGSTGSTATMERPFVLEPMAALLDCSWYFVVEVILNLGCGFANDVSFGFETP